MSIGRKLFRPIGAIGAGLALAAGLGACSEQPDPARLTFGAAVRHNIEVQAVNPLAGATVEPPALDGRRAALKHGQYITDKVEEPRRIGTTTVGEGQ